MGGIRNSPLAPVVIASVLMVILLSQVMRRRPVAVVSPASSAEAKPPPWYEDYDAHWRYGDHRFDGTCPWENTAMWAWQLDPTSAFSARYMRLPAHGAEVAASVRVAFVAARHKGIYFPSKFHRGVEAAAYLNATMVDCNASDAVQVLAQFDVVVHVKDPCDHVLFGLPRARHVLDVIDGGGPKPAHPFAGNIFNTHDQLRTHCRAPVCVVIPHHFNIDCSRRDPAAMWARLNSSQPRRVGLVGKLPEVKSLQAAIEAAGDTMSVEDYPNHDIHLLPTKDKICEWLLANDIVLAWTKLDTDSMQLHFKPAERYTNSAFMRIPTIGHRDYSAFQEFGPHSPMLCGTMACITDTLVKLRTGNTDIVKAVKHQLACVEKGMAVAEVLYRQLFGTLGPAADDTLPRS